MLALFSPIEIVAVLGFTVMVVMITVVLGVGAYLVYRVLRPPHG